LQRDLTPASKLSLNGSVTRATFDDVTAIDYTRDDAFVRYEGNLRKVDYELDLGYSRLDRDAPTNASMTLARASVEWHINPESRLRFRVRHQFADEVRDLIVRLNDPEEAVIPDLVDESSTFVTSGVYRQRSVELDYRHVGERFGFRVRPMYRRFIYVDRDDPNRTERSVFAEVNYHPVPRMNVFLNGTLRDRDFLSVARGEHDFDHVYHLGVDYQLSRHWGWRAEAIRNDRSSNLSDPAYRENAVQFMVWWKR